MGIVYCGPYADAIGNDAHEGYAARILPDGTDTGTWTWQTREFRGYRARCSCGWRGTSGHPANDRGQRAAEDEWDHDHLQPLVRAEAARHTVAADVLLALRDELRDSLTCTVDAAGDERLTERSQGIYHAIQRLEQLLDDLAHRANENGR
jgi:hypothetical protein